MTIHWKAVEQYFTGVLCFDFTQFIILEKLSFLDLALLGVKGLIRTGIRIKFITGRWCSPLTFPDDLSLPLLSPARILICRWPAEAY